MNITGTILEGVFLIQNERHTDTRGSFMESFGQDILNTSKIQHTFVQDNLVESKRNVIRGLHFKKKYPQVCSSVNEVRNDYSKFSNFFEENC